MKKNKKNNADSEIRFRLSYKNSTQLSFDGRNLVVKNPVGVVELTRGGFPLCKKDMDLEDKRLGADGHSTYVTIPSSNVCPACIEIYKREPGSKWRKWVCE